MLLTYCWNMLEYVKVKSWGVNVTSLTDDVGLPSEDGVLKLVRHHTELVVRCPVNSDGVVGGCAQLLSDTRRVRS